MASTIIVHSEPLAERFKEGDFSEVSGDIFNIAADIARLNPTLSAFYAKDPQKLKVGVFAAVGDDRGNPRGNHASMITKFADAEGIDRELMLTIPDKLTGAYTITPLDNGEKRVSYHDRHDAAMRQLFELPEINTVTQRLQEKLRPGSEEDKNYFVVTGIAASRPRNPEAFERLLETIRAAKQAGATIVFDPNNRQKLWTDEHDHYQDSETPPIPANTERDIGQAEALAVSRMDAIFALTDLVFMTYPDDTRSYQWASTEESANKLLQRFPTIRTIVMKEGDKGAQAFHRNEKGDIEKFRQPVIPAERQVDSSGAGDSMAAAFLIAQAYGATVPEALAIGALAGSVTVEHPGGVIAPQAVAKLGEKIGPVLKATQASLRHTNPQQDGREF